MKLVELLARELKEWPIVQGVAAVFACQERDGEMFFTHNQPPEFQCGSVWHRSEGDDGECGYAIPPVFLLVADDWDSAIVTREMWQADRDRIAPKESKDGWIRHRGGKCPVEAGTKVSTRHRDGKIVDVHHMTAYPMASDVSLKSVWSHKTDYNDIMAYRVCDPAAETLDEKVMRDCVEKCASTEASSEPIYNAQAIEHGPIQWRDRIEEIDDFVDDLETERADLVRRLADEGLALLCINGKAMPKYHP